jgi:hypothetical protein
MSFFKKLFGTGNPSSSDDENNSDYRPSIDEDAPIEEQFIFNFKNNGGKFLYCENETEIKDQFENILAENDWFESEALCNEPKLFSLLQENKIKHTAITKPSFLFGYCENLIAEEGSILLSSKQIKQLRPNELPENIVIFATTSQIIGSKSDGLSFIKKKYVKDYPSNITTIKYFKKAIDEDFTHYGSTAKNLYLLLLEDL